MAGGGARPPPPPPGGAAGGGAGGLTVEQKNANRGRQGPKRQHKQ
ncbi:hypothetical protein ABIC13_003615, partial [Sphingomonas sp. PvP015]